MALELVEDSLGDPRNATALALASDLAYLPEAEAAVAFEEQLSLDARLISVNNIQVYIAQNDDHIVAAFRGTESPTTIEGLKDWLLTDAVNLLIIPEGRLGTDFIAAGVGARFHQGFMTALAAIWDPLEAAIKAEIARKDRPFWITGHSLGGALAMLSAWLFDRKFYSVHQVYTYGAPMIGNSVASAAFDKAFPKKIYRFVNRPDPVPKLPTMSLVANDYTHGLEEIALGPTDAAGSTLEMFQGIAGRTLNGEIINDIWKNVLARVSAHGLDNYRKLLKEHFEK